MRKWTLTNPKIRIYLKFYYIQRSLMGVTYLPDRLPDNYQQYKKQCKKTPPNQHLFKIYKKAGQVSQEGVFNGYLGV